MNDFVYNLPPVKESEVKCELKDLSGYLEIEVTFINFINLWQNFETELVNDRAKDIGIQNCNKNSASVNENCQDLKTLSSIGSNESPKNCNITKNDEEINISLQVKIVWSGERKEDAAHITIGCKRQQQQPQEQIQTVYNKITKTKRKYSKKKINRSKNPLYKQKHKQLKRTQLLLSANNKLRYRIYTSATLFLDYLRFCKPLHIIVSQEKASKTTADSCLPIQYLGQATYHLPSLLLKKFQHNIVKGQNFAFKTKVFPFYQYNPKTIKNSCKKSGVIQLRFNMLFAPTAVASASAVAGANHGQHVIHEKQHHHLHNNHCHHHHQHNHRHHHHHNLVGKNGNKVVSKDVQGDIPKRLTSQTKSEEIVEAMKKLDAKLVAYLAGETEISTKLTNCEEENEVNLNLENQSLNNNLADLLPATKFNIFKTIQRIKLEMEALTLQAEGTKCMQLLESEIEPIFTVECQLSNELIKKVPRHDMFHIMQFESEKFQSLTQCCRFAQKAERNVKLDLADQELSDENANETVLDFGRIHFTVWWREPGTCLNELLGMGVLELKDLYDASLLEQCKRIEIQRRGKHLACLYFKITLQREDTSNAKQMKRELFLPNQLSSDSDSEKTPASTDKNKTATGQQQSAAQNQSTINAGAGPNNNNIANDKGEYAENFLYLKHTKIQ